jgi:YidC/Oxa1 family membrane protein insertase
MSTTRTFLLLLLCIVGWAMWSAWEKDYGIHPAPPVAASDAPATAVPPPGADLPSAPARTGDPALPPTTPTSSTPSPTTAPVETPRIHVRTDVFDLEIDTAGGTLRRLALRNYPISPDDREHLVTLFTSAPQDFNIAQSGLFSAVAPAPDHNAVYSSERTSYELADGAAELSVPLVWRAANGIVVTRTYTFRRGSYVVGLSDRLDNQGEQPWVGSAYRQLQRVAGVKTSGFSITSPESYSFVGASWYSPEKKFEKLAFDKFAAEPLQRDVSGGWIAMLQHHFLAAWIPDAADKDSFSTTEITATTPARYVLRDVGPAVTVKPGDHHDFGARLYVGPKLQNELETIAPGLEKTVDYGRVTVIAEPLFHWVLSPIHGLVGNWGWAIILTTLLIKLVMFPLSESQFRSMAKMRAMQPRLEALKQRYGDDKEKLNQAMIDFYKKEKINPAGGCFPILLQMPVFIALYWVLIESVEMRQAPFMFWIQNLSAKDPYFILPALNAAVMFVTQRLSPTTGMDPAQAKMMQMMPIVFGVMFAFFPSGLVLYWVVNGLLSLVQQVIIMRRHEAAQAKTRA